MSDIKPQISDSYKKLPAFSQKYILKGKQKQSSSFILFHIKF